MFRRSYYSSFSKEKKNKLLSTHLVSGNCTATQKFGGVFFFKLKIEEKKKKFLTFVFVTRQWYFFQTNQFQN